MPPKCRATAAAFSAGLAAGIGRLRRARGKSCRTRATHYIARRCANYGTDRPQGAHVVIRPVQLTPLFSRAFDTRRVRSEARLKRGGEGGTRFLVPTPFCILPAQARALRRTTRRPSCSPGPLSFLIASIACLKSFDFYSTLPGRGIQPGIDPRVITRGYLVRPFGS